MNDRNVYAPPASRVSDTPDAVSPVDSALESPPFFPVSIPKLVVMSAFTLGLYELYWIYQQWSYIKQREGGRIHPFWRAFFPYFFCYQLFRKVRDYDQPALELSNLPAGPLAAGWIVVSLLWRLPDPYWLLSYFAFLFLIPVQLRVNYVNDTVAPGHDRNSRFTWKNWVFLGLGGSLLILATIGTVMPDVE